MLVFDFSNIQFKVKMARFSTSELQLGKLTWLWNEEDFLTFDHSMDKYFFHTTKNF